MKYVSSGKVVAGVVLLSLLVMSPLTAHSPKEIEMSFDMEKSELSVTVTHEVKNAARHYVESIRVYVNDTLISTKKYDRQESLTQQSDTFPLRGVKSGDVIKVEASCSRIGGKRAEITV